MDARHANPSMPGDAGPAGKQATVLLIGPTGAGKTPLGECLESRGLWGRRCVHLDFGTQLRAIAGGAAQRPGLSAEDLRVIVRALEANALLEKENFRIAAAIVRGVVEGRAVRSGDLLLLNGLPRHVSQAEDVDALLDVEGVIYLDCTAEVVAERIRLNSGGDRGGRTDDDAAAVARKLRIFSERTVPILDHYASKRVWIERVRVTPETSPRDIWGRLERSGSRRPLR
jgi:adenylate kinase